MKRSPAIILLVFFCQFLLLQDILLVQAQNRQKYTLAVLNFTMTGEGYNRLEINSAGARLTGELAARGSFATMSNSDMELALRSTDIDPYECASIACGVQAGKKMGVQLIVSGTIIKRSASFLVTARLLHVNSGIVVKMVEENIPGSWPQLQARIPAIAQKLAGKKRGDRPVAAEASSRYPKGSSFRWYYAGLGLIMAGGVGLLLLNNSDGTNENSTANNSGDPASPTGPLPGPPDFP